jgi:hypothetical protein
MTPSPKRLAQQQAEADEHSELVARHTEESINSAADSHFRIVQNERGDYAARAASMSWIWQHAGNTKVRNFLRYFEFTY